MSVFMLQTTSLLQRAVKRFLFGHNTHGVSSHVKTIFYSFCKIRVGTVRNESLFDTRLFESIHSGKGKYFWGNFYAFHILCSWFYTWYRVVNVWHMIQIGLGRFFKKLSISKSAMRHTTGVYSFLHPILLICTALECGIKGDWIRGITDLR